ncbi:helix-turn-helix domain-containing protein [Saccharothrix syringae]|uniref:AraC family transcriptional regulator n=1 Tax=Saccharothrix syringae TaxID=103733 RepID=A0A5Q0H4L2_SACSY|nr:AraC family transcriptional regulator [Saccharothrix syringae]QFZ20864.1 AraC family transcriptional regulator [Saccharothrix syringae]
MDESHLRRWRPPQLPGVEVVSGRIPNYTRPRFTLSSGYTIKIRHRGAPPAVRYRGRDQEAGAAGAVTVVEPDEVVQALGGHETRAEFDLLLVDAALLPRGASGPPRFHRLAYPDRALFDGIAALHRGLARDEDQLALQSVLACLLDDLVTRHATAPRPTDPALGPPALRRVREVLHDRLDANVSLDELATVAGCGKHHLVRSFRRVYGVPPHRYRTLLRLDRAMAMLVRGRSVADVAAALGYCDQSQLNRHFRQVFGMSAGAYAKAVR